MLDWDRLQELLSSLRHNKLRTLLTASGVFWGMLMLVSMLGFGNGLRAGVAKNMLGYTTNSVYLWGQRTTLPYRGLQPGRPIRYTNQDILPLASLPHVETLAPRLQLGGWRDGNTVTYGKNSAGFGVMGDTPEIAKIESINVIRGRFLNARDLEEHRKVAVISEQPRRILFGQSVDPIGKFISIQGVYFQVVGYFKSEAPGEAGERANTRIHVPLTTLQQAFNLDNKIAWFAVTAPPGVQAELLEKELRQTIAVRHSIHPKDHHAIGSFNAGKRVSRMLKLFDGVEFFIWIVSIATLLAGVLGVSNIMLVNVKERTREFGVRKALGATPTSIISQVLQEATLLTALAGYSGLICGVALLELSARWNTGTGPLGAPSINLSSALIAALVLALSGMLSGVVPASHAARIRPVEALRAD